MLITHIFEGCGRPDREGMYSKRGNTTGIFNPYLEDGNHFEGFTVEHIERNENTEANDLAKVAARNTPMPTDVFFQVIEGASVKTVVSGPRLINIIEREDWRAPIMVYLHHYYESYSINEKTRIQQ
jgi:hypothetical protein